METIEEFIQAKALSPGCKKMYPRTLKGLTEFLQGQGTTLLEATPEALVAWFESLQATVGDTTRCRKLSEARSFYLYGVKRGWRADDPTASIERPKGVKNRVVTFLTMPEQRALLDAPDKRTRLGRRDATIMQVLVHNLRLAEVVSLNQRDVSAPARGRPARLKVRGKGRKERLVPLSPDAWELLRKHLDTLPQRAPALPLFPGPIAVRISPSTIQRRLKHYATKAGVDLEKAHPHAFRHGYGTALVEADVDLDSIARLMGHSSVATTQRYLHQDTRHIERAAALHPLWQRRNGKVIAFPHTLGARQAPLPTKKDLTAT